MVVATPGDPVEARVIANLSANYEGPMYIRLGKAGEKIVHDIQLTKVEIGDILPVLKKNGDVAVIACGSIVNLAKLQILENRINADLYSVPFVKPISKMQLVKMVSSYPLGFIVIEEHQKSCGAGSAILEQLSDLYADGIIKSFPRVKRLAIDDLFIPIVGDQSYLRQVANLTLI